MLDHDLDRRWAHICVDMQSLFAEETDWHAPWLKRVLPAVEALVERSAERTVFTRFLPPSTPQQAVGAWRQYYERWASMTRRQLPAELLDLVPPLARFVPPARVFDKAIYSPWLSGDLHGALQSAGISTLVISGGETDICVLATVLGAIDLGYRVILPVDALFGSADATHDAMIGVYSSRFQLQLTTTNVAELFEFWRELDS
jgi:nicotinamidase-related amidase